MSPLRLPDRRPFSLPHLRYSSEYRIWSQTANPWIIINFKNDQKYSIAPGEIQTVMPLLAMSP